MAYRKWLHKCMATVFVFFVLCSAGAQSVHDEWVRVDVPDEEVPATLTKVERAFVFFVKKNAVASREGEPGFLETALLMQIPEEKIESVKGQKMPVKGASYEASEISVVIPIFIECEKKLKRQGPWVTYSERYGKGKVLESSQIGTEFAVDFYPDDPIEARLMKMVCGK